MEVKVPTSTGIVGCMPKKISPHPTPIMSSLFLRWNVLEYFSWQENSSQFCMAVERFNQQDLPALEALGGALAVLGTLQCRSLKLVDHTSPYSVPPPIVYLPL